MRSFISFAAVTFLSITAALAQQQSSPQILPDAEDTPGMVASTDESVVCGYADGTTYSKSHRKTPPELKRTVRLRDHAFGDGEVDHRVPLCLGGADEEANLWWQPGNDHGTDWTYHVKDKLEAFACQQVCREHKAGLAEAQSWFLKADWREAYCREIGGEPCPIK